MHDKNKERVFQMSITSVYPHYIAKVEEKGRNKSELDQVIRWLTGYSQQELEHHLENKTSFLDFFEKAPEINPNANKITGVICGYRVEEIQDPMVRNIRYLDKLVDELAKGKAMDKILRS